MENRQQIPMLPLDRHTQQTTSSREVRGVVIVSVPDGDGKDGKTVCAAFTFQDQQQHRVATNGPQYAPVPTQVVEDTLPPPGRRPPWRRFMKRSFLIIAGFLLLAVFAFALFKGLSSGPVEEQWDDSEKWAHVHRIYTKRLVSMAPENRSDDYIPETGLLERDYSRRKLWERVVVRGRQEVNSSPSFPVHGNVYPDGLYYMQLQVGTPPKPYFVDIDTGSDLTWLQCNVPGAHCAETPHPLYNPGGASIVDCRQPACSLLQQGSRYGCNGAATQCDYEIEYGDSSSTMGVLVSDQLSLTLSNGSFVKEKIVFGCSYDQQGSLAESPSKTDGLLGLNSAKLALPAQLAAKGIVKNVIAHCLAGGNRGGGYLFFGDELVPSWGMTWTPIVKKHGDDNYFVSVTKVQYGSSTLEDGGDYDFVFDSGTSYTYLVPELFSAFIEAVQKGLEGSGLEQDLSDTTLPYCWRGKTPFRSVTEASHYFQPVTLNFGTQWFLTTKFMIIIPQSYLIITPQGNVCMGIMDSSDAGSEEINIIGDISLRGHLVIYDNVNHRVGWMPSDCQKPPKSKLFTYVS
ncbi:unnamed protein product [Calypogeia fissa]